MLSVSPLRLAIYLIALTIVTWLLGAFAPLGHGVGEVAFGLASILALAAGLTGFAPGVNTPLRVIVLSITLVLFFFCFFMPVF